MLENPLPPLASIDKIVVDIYPFSSDLSYADKKSDVTITP
jgi:hypothetical protein